VFKPSIVEKLKITFIYTSLQTDGKKVTHCILAKHSKCSRGFAGKIIKEVKDHEGVVDPSSKKENCQTGIGSRCLMGNDIHMMERSLRDYQACQNPLFHNFSSKGCPTEQACARHLCHLATSSDEKISYATKNSLNA
jgi:hypothetical protein